MSIVGALMGFAIIAIIVGAIGTIVMACMWSDASGWDNTQKYRTGFGVCLALLFIGAILVGGLG